MSSIKSLTPNGRKFDARMLRIAREMRADSYSPSTIARRLGVSQQTISANTKGIAKPHSKEGW